MSVQNDAIHLFAAFVAAKMVIRFGPEQAGTQRFIYYFRLSA
jgi:hypothetical protein